LSNKLLIIGAGGHGRSLAEAVLAENIFGIACFVDDNASIDTTIFGFPVLGVTADLSLLTDKASHVIVAIGHNALRQQLCQQAVSLGFKLATVIHPRAIVSPSAIIGDGVAIMAGAIVGTEARLGIGAIVNCGAVVDHHAKVEDFGHLGVNACMAGGSVLGAGAWMQAGSSLGYGVTVASNQVLLPSQGVVA
jgi:sugar O-acyltransferase (sialic acid O-acetyltransferase NeuD family)